MDEKSFERAKTLLENFNKLAPNIQNQLINAVKCVALLYDLADVKDDETQPYRMERRSCLNYRSTRQ